MVTSEKSNTSGGCGVTSGANAEGSFATQTFTFAKVFKDSRIGEAGVMLDIQQVGAPDMCVSFSR